jgi:toxin ParE1/3/4
VSRIVWSPHSLRDLQSIHAYIAPDSAIYADLVVQRIVDAVERLPAFPGSGRVVPERGDASLRELIVRPYRIVYRVRGTIVEIATVFHAARLFPSNIK